MKLLKYLTGGLFFASIAIGTASAEDKKKDIVDTAVSNGNFKTLAAALTAAGLVDALKGDGPFTVFAPNDEAFAKLPKETLASLLKPENKDKLVDILTYHVVSGEVPAKVAVTLKKATALNKKTINVKKKKAGLFLNKSKVIATDIKASNGVIHVIDTVLLPPSNKQASSTSASSELIEVAIDKAVPLFNHGQHQACAAIYEVTAQALMSMPKGSVAEKDRDMLQRAMKMVSHSRCMTTKAWTLRKAFDAMLVANR